MVARQTHNLKVEGSNLSPATNNLEETKEKNRQLPTAKARGFPCRNVMKKSDKWTKCGLPYGPIYNKSWSM